MRMKRLVAGLLVAAAAVSGVSLAAFTLKAREDHFPLAPVTDRILYLRSGRTADRLALSFDGIVADVYWIRTIQHYGRDYKNRGRAVRFELLQPLLDLTTTLDPHFLIAYRFGAIFLALAPPDGPGRPDLSIALLEKGIAANPEKWQLAYDVAFTHYLYTGDYQAAASWFRKAMAMPKAPEWLGPLAAATAAKGGNRQGARQLLLELRNTQEEYIRKVADRTMKQIDALDLIDNLQRSVDLFKARTGRDASGWPDLVAAGLLPGMPVDPTGVPLVFDPVLRRPALAPESSLLPLPPMLLGK